MNEKEYHEKVGIKLESGSLYWALPVHDCDDDTGFVNIVQPARFMGYDEKGDAKWWWLNTENEDWPDRWIGEKIEPPDIFNNKGNNDA